MIPIADARRFVLAHCPLLEPRGFDVGGAAGLVLADPVRARENVPSFANSAVDGYALRAADAMEPNTRLEVVATIMAGQTRRHAIRQGEAARIMTGALLPTGADAVCMLEYAIPDGMATVVIEKGIPRGANVREPGCDGGPGFSATQGGSAVQR